MEPHFENSIATCGYHIGQHRLRAVVIEGEREEGRKGAGGSGVQGASRKWPGTGSWGRKLESRKASRQSVFRVFAGISLVPWLELCCSDTFDSGWARRFLRAFKVKTCGSFGAFEAN